MTLATAYRKAAELSTRYQTGVRDLREHFVSLKSQKVTEQKAAKQKLIAEELAKALDEQRKITLRTLFDRWAKVKLASHTRTRPSGDPFQLRNRLPVQVPAAGLNPAEAPTT